MNRDKPMAHKRLGALFDELARREEEFQASEFVAPALPGEPVQTLVGGVLCSFRVRPAPRAGWGVFRATDAATATSPRPATQRERQQWLDNHEGAALLLLFPRGRDWWAWREDDSEPVVIRLIEQGKPFEMARARRQGERWWFDCWEPAVDPGQASYLRGAWEARISGAGIHYPGLPRWVQNAYSAAWTRFPAAELL